MPDQQELWHDSLEDALRDVVHALGGTKEIGYRLWPGKGPQEASKYLSRILDSTRAEKPTLGELLLILKWGREAGVHTAMGYIAQETGYKAEPVEPEDERAALQREFNDSVKRLEKIQRDLARVNGG
jgi:hypothetical protein